MLKTVIISLADGLQKAEQVRQKYFQDRAKLLLKNYSNELAAMFNEPMIIDQSVRPSSIEELACWLVTNAETLICKDGDQVVGIGIYFGVIPGRSATFIGWISPEYRKSKNFLEARQKGATIKEFWQDDMIPYAFKKFEVAKIETRCCTLNQRAINFALRTGFKAVGISRLDYAIQNQLYDSVIFEYLNPVYQVEPVEEKVHAPQSKRPAAKSVSDNDGDEWSEPEQQPASARTSDELADEYAIERPVHGRGGSRSAGRRDAAEVSATFDEEPASGASGYTAEDSPDLRGQSLRLLDPSSTRRSSNRAVVGGQSRNFWELDLRS